MALKSRSTVNTEAKKAAQVKKVEKVVEKTKVVTPKPSKVLFVSAREEVSQFDITVAGQRINSMWDNEREHLIWRVPAELADRFAMHEFVVKGRIIRED